MGKVYLVVALLIVTTFAFITGTRKISAEPTQWFNNQTEAKNLEVRKSPLPEVSKTSLGTFTTGDTAVDSYIVDACAKHNVDPLLIFAQMNQESRFKQKATSHKGASGLMQLMPDTAVRFGVKDIYDPQQNIEAGVKYMRWLLNKFDQNVQLSLAAYNAGEGAVMKYGNQIPPYRETQTYVARITAHYIKIKTPNLVKTPLGGNQAVQEVASLITK
jgi:soluble lytic murein transglycosylase-like protein